MLAQNFREKLLSFPENEEIFDRDLDLPIYSIYFDFSLSWKEGEVCSCRETSSPKLPPSLFPVLIMKRKLIIVISVAV